MTDIETDALRGNGSQDRSAAIDGHRAIATKRANRQRCPESVCAALAFNDHRATAANGQVAGASSGTCLREGAHTGADESAIISDNLEQTTIRHVDRAGIAADPTDMDARRACRIHDDR